MEKAEILSQLSSYQIRRPTRSPSNPLESSRPRNTRANKGGKLNESGEFSLQNGREVAGRSLGHQPRHGSRELVVLFGALILTETIPRMQAANVRVSSFALSAELHVCRKLAEETIGVMGVCLDKGHFRDWLLGGQCTPPPAIPHSLGSGGSGGCKMVHVGFPTRPSGDVPAIPILARTAFVYP